MIEIAVNGKPHEVEEGMTLAALVARYLEEVRLGPEMVTVALNGTVIPRDELAVHLLATGDQIEYLLFMGGGAR